MKVFDDYKTIMLVMLGDENQKRYNDEAIKTGLRMALKDYDLYLPHKTETMLPISQAKGCQFFVNWYPAPDQTILGIRIGGSDNSLGVFSGSATSFGYKRISNGSLITLIIPEIYISNGDKVILELSEKHTIENLAGSTATTVPDGHMETVCQGGTGYAMQIRAASIGEVFGKRIEDYENLLQQGTVWIHRFLQDLETLSMIHGEYDAAVPTAGFHVDD